MSQPHQFQKTSVQTSKKLSRPVTRREFLAVLVLGTGLGAAGGLGIGYLLNADQAETTPPTATSDPTRSALVKTAERPPVVGRADWGARPVNLAAENESGLYTPENPQGYLTYAGDLALAYNTVVIHHSSLYIEDDATTMAAIQNLHMDDRGWADIGYHYGVGKGGIIYEGRKLVARGTHTAGHNTGTLGVCLLGNYEVDTPATAQLEAAQKLLNWAALRLQLTHLAGHRDFNDITVCPGKNLYPYLEQFAQNALLALGTEGYIAPTEEATPTATPNTAWRVQNRCVCPGCCQKNG
jgi:hypothetical protein